MIIFILLLAIESKIVRLKPEEVSLFSQQNSNHFLVIYFCDFSLDPCNFFTNTTSSFFLKLNGKVAKVNVSTREEAELLKQYEIKDLPYIIYIKPSQKFRPYTGSLEPIEIFTALDRIQKGPAEYSDIESVHKDLEDKLYSDGLVLGYKQDDFLALADSLIIYFPFAVSNFLPSFEEYQCTGPCVIVFRPNILQEKGVRSWTVIHGQAPEGQIKKEYYKGLVWMTPNSHLWLDKEKPLMTLYGKISGKSDPSNTKYVVNRYLLIAKEYFELFTVAIAKIDDFLWILQDIGLGEHKSLIMFDDTEDMYYEADVISSNFSVNLGKIRLFVDKFIDGKLEPYIISEKLPKEPIQNNIKVLVGSTVKEELANIKKDSILLVYTYYYEELSSVIFLFEELAKRMAEIQFFKIESHRNYVPPSYTDFGYPAAFYIKPGYEPQFIKIDLENPKATVKIISTYFKSSQDL